MFAADFGKKYRLSGLTKINVMFQQPISVKSYPFLIRKKWETQLLDAPVKWLIVVPKKRFRKATLRNAIRRKIREAIRKNHQELLNLCQNKEKTLNLALFYNGNPQETSHWIETKIRQVLTELQKNC